MDWVGASALASWRLDWGILLPLLVTAVLYGRGWRILHREQPQRYPDSRWWCFYGGLTALVLAILSPLDAFAGFLLQVHMVQHLLLLMVAPPLLWLGQPILPLVRAVPARFVRDAFGPFLHSPGLRKFAAFFVHPVVAWLLFNGMVIGWHLPRFYDLGLRDRGWHEFEHLCFLSTALLFWWPVIEVWPSHRHWPRALMIPYLLLADFVNTGLSAFLAFSGGVLFDTYQSGPRLWGISAADDQVTAGVIMWVPGSLAYLVPAVVIAMQLLTPRRSYRAKSVGRIGAAAVAKASAAGSKRAPWDLLRLPVIGSLLRQRYARRVAQFIMLMVAATVVWDGFFRTASQLAESGRCSALDSLAGPGDDRPSGDGQCLLHGVSVHAAARVGQTVISEEAPVAAIPPVEVAGCRSVARLPDCLRSVQPLGPAILDSVDYRRIFRGRLHG